MDCNEISCLTLKTKEIRLDIKGVQLWFDFAKILKSKDDVYVNVTSFLKDFQKVHQTRKSFKLKDYLKSPTTKAYIEALEKYFKEEESSPLKFGLFYKRTGRYGGTWLHKDLLIDFMRWLSPEFAVICDQIVKQILLQADELKEGRDVLRKLQRPLNDAIKLKLVDTEIKTDSAYIQFAVMVKRLIGCPDDRDAYTKTQLDTAKLIIEEYRAMIIHGNKTSLKEMNNYLRDTPLNLAWQKEN
jgi:hypothetical protein